MADFYSLNRSTHVLHGVADRDSDELVCMFFPTRDELEEFRATLPGTYQMLILSGVDVEDFNVFTYKGTQRTNG